MIIEMGEKTNSKYALGAIEAPNSQCMNTRNRVYATCANTRNTDQCRWQKNGMLSSNMKATLITVDVYIENVSQLPVPCHSELGACQINADTLRKKIEVLQRDGSKLRKSLIKTRLDFMLNCIDTATRGHRKTSSAIKLVIMIARNGFAASANLLQLRMADHPYICNTADFVTPGQRLPTNFLLKYPQDLLEVLEDSIGGVLVTSCDDQSISNALDEVEYDLASRIPMHWVLDKPSVKTRLALVEGRPNRTVGDWVFKAANDLGISLVVLDREGHWLQDAQSYGLREDFLAIDSAIDEGLPMRIIEALQSLGKPIDGITTFSDHYLVVVAKVAELLNLPTSPPAAFEKSRDKYESRMLAADKSQVLRADTVSELRKVIEKQPNSLEYPLIVKPTGGYGSEGVAKVNTFDDLLRAAANIDSSRHGNGILVETYVDGPEVDANFVLLDGQILFFEMSDDFPCNADGDDAVASDHFLELSVALPTKLSGEEVETTRNFLHQNLIKLGFRSGVFHVEARIQNSRMRYRSVDGTLDLHERLDLEPIGKPSAFLIEVNARCPNMVCTYATAKTYGVNYYMMHMLLAAKDNERLRALSQPYSTGPQYYCEIAMVPVTHGGCFASEDPCRDLEERCPELTANVSKSGCLFKQGDIVPDPASGVLTWIAYFLVFSRISRVDVLVKAEEIRSQFHYVVT